MTSETKMNVGEPVVADEFDKLHQKLATFVQGENWSELSPLIKRRDELLSTMTDPRQRATLIEAAIKMNDGMLKLAQAGSQAVALKLTALRRHRDATRHSESQRAVRNALLDA